MKDFAVMVDVTCDVSEPISSTYGVEVIHGHYSTPDGKEHPSVLEWKDITREEFYAELKKNPNGFMSSPPNIDECFLAFEKEVLSGKDVICLSISKSLSGTFDFMNKAAERIREKYPESKIAIVDSMRFGPGAGLMSVYAAKMRNEGRSFEETLEFIETNKNRFHQMGWLDDLSFVAKKGRISHAKAFFGQLVGVKPLGEFDYSGMTTVIGKAKGEKAAYNAIISYIEKTIENPSEQIIFIANSKRRPFAEKLKALIEEKFSPKELYVNDVYPNCGINVGPGLMAAYYIGKPISADLSEEKKLMDEITSKN